jgi:hypothetical protein
MITKFNIHNLIVEKAGISLEIKSLSEKIFDLIKNNTKKNYNFNGNIFNLSIMHIDKINITINNLTSSFSISDSKITPKGFTININLNKDDISVPVIYHELEHALKYYMIGKDKTLEISHKLKSHRLGQEFIKNEEIKEFISLYYYSQNHEIDSFIGEVYYETIENFKQLINKKGQKINMSQFNMAFNLFIHESYIYEISQILKKYNFKKLKEYNSKDLIIFFNILNDQNNVLKVSRSSNKIKKLYLAIKDIYNIYYNKEYYNKIDKSIKIDNIDDVLNKYKNRFDAASKKITKKLSRLYDLVLDEFKHNIIS